MSVTLPGIMMAGGFALSVKQFRNASSPMLPMPAGITKGLEKVPPWEQYWKAESPMAVRLVPKVIEFRFVCIKANSPIVTTSLRSTELRLWQL
jgi:hypothetical protein